MKIIYLLNTFPKLSESFVLNEIIYLLKNDHDVHIFSLKNLNEDIFHDDFINFNLSSRIHYFNIRKITYARFNNIFKYFIVSCIQDLLNFKIPNIPVNLKLAYFATLVTDNDIDLIHTHFIGHIARKFSKMVNIQYTVTNHAVEIFRNNNIDKLKKSIENAKLIFTPSIYNKKYLIGNTGCDEKKIKIIHATINPEKFTRVNYFHSDHEIIMTGRLVEKKGMKYMILAMKQIIEKHPDTLLKIVGEGPLEDELKELVRMNYLGNNVTFLGSISDEEYYKELESSSIAVLPCIITENGDRDVCPLTLQEAMSMELPVVSTNVHSVPELIDNEVSGILVPPKDEKQLANAIIRLLDNPQLRQNMGEKGREKIIKEFNIESQVDKQIMMWTSLLKDYI